MIRVSDDYEDYSSINEMKNSMRMESQEYDLDSFLQIDENNKIVINSEEELIQYSEYNELYENILECERFFKTKAGKMLTARFAAIKKAKVDDFSSAQPHELLKVQAEYNAWEIVLGAVSNMEFEKKHIQDLMNE